MTDVSVNIQSIPTPVMFAAGQGGITLSGERVSGEDVLTWAVGADVTGITRLVLYQAPSVGGELVAIENELAPASGGITVSTGINSANDYQIVGVAMGIRRPFSNVLELEDSLPPEVPAAPSGLSLAGDELFWTDNSDDEDGFRVEAAEDGDSFAELDTVAANEESFITGLTFGAIQYAFRVYSFNAAGDSADPSGTVYSAPMAPVLTDIFFTTSFLLTVAWTHPVHTSGGWVDSYVIEARNETVSGAWHVVASPATSEDALEEDISLVAGGLETSDAQNCEVRVKAIKGGLSSAWSNVLSDPMQA